MSEQTGTHFYAPFITFDGSSPRRQYDSLGAIYHHLKEPPANIPDNAVHIIMNTLLTNPSLAEHREEIEKKLKSGELIAHLMYKVKAVAPSGGDEILSHGIGFQRKSLPLDTKKADDWEVITDETCKQVKFY